MLEYQINFVAKEKVVERVLRIICGCIVFGKFHDGLHITSDCQKNASVYCHTRTHLHRSCSRFSADLYCCHSSNSISHYKTDTVPRVCKHMHDSSRTKNQKHTVFSKSNHHVVYRKFSSGWNHGGLPAICKGRKSLFGHRHCRILSGSWNLEVCFLYAEMEPVPLHGGFVSGE